MNLIDYLTSKGIEFEAILHEDTYDAQRMAATIHVSGREVAKTVLLKTGGGEHAIAVLPANREVDLEKVAQTLGDGKVELATEFEISQLFADCDLGAIPPFGSRYGLQTLVDGKLAADEQIVFEGNTHHEAFRIRFDDFRALERPLIVDLVVD